MNLIKFNNEKDKLSGIDYIRVFALITLVIWHSICVYTGWKNQLPEITSALTDNEIVIWWEQLARLLIPDAQMPLFTIISGFIYSYLYHYKDKYKDFKHLIQNKIKRLLIPYFIIGTIVVITIYDWPLISIIKGQAHHLWYCIMLFWCFLAIGIFDRCSSRIKAFIIILSLILQYIKLNFPILGLDKFLFYFPYFLFGYYIALYYNELKKYIPISIVIILYLAFTYLIKLGSFSEIIRCYLFSTILLTSIPMNIKTNKAIKLLSKYSFGIYVFHEWFMWNIAHLPFMKNIIIQHTILYPIILFTIVFSISTILTHISLKTKIGKYLLL